MTTVTELKQIDESVKNIRQMKEEAEAVIFNELNNLEIKTGLKVSDLDMSRLFKIDGTREIYQIKITLEV
ncbi:MAG TPA: hypothetical protein PLD56_12075 [Chitinophagales bacterium]|nr:hypothetical protein [Chitinophagales bacterium]